MLSNTLGNFPLTATDLLRGSEAVQAVTLKITSDKALDYKITTTGIRDLQDKAHKWHFTPSPVGGAAWLDLKCKWRRG